MSEAIRKIFAIVPVLIIALIRFCLNIDILKAQRKEDRRKYGNLDEFLTFFEKYQEFKEKCEKERKIGD